MKKETFLKIITLNERVEDEATTGTHILHFFGQGKVRTFWKGMSVATMNSTAYDIKDLTIAVVNIAWLFFIELAKRKAIFSSKTRSVTSTISCFDPTPT